LSYIEAFFCLFDRYYFAFILSEAINNAAGLGFDGYENGEARWNLLTNVKPFQLETATSLKVILDLWNMREKKNKRKRHR
jgi:lysophospholipid acyltransferase 1/2